MEPTDPRRPPPPPEPVRSRLSILLALVLFVIVVALLTVLTLGYFGLVLFTAAILFGLVLFHYFFWGRWLGRILREEEERDSDDSPGVR